jgi:YHS domain-containing protein
MSFRGVFRSVPTVAIVLSGDVAYDTTSYMMCPTVEQRAMASECPVCGSYVDEDVPTADTEYDGDRYTFESAKCKEKFDKDPGEYT